MDIIFGYCRISTKKQNIERQERNILQQYPEAHIIKETFTGTKSTERKEWSKLTALAKKEAANGNNVTIIFDSVSRMSRNAEEGFKEYKDLYQAGIRLVFLKEMLINTDTYRQALAAKVPMTGTNADILLSAVNEYLMILAQEQIRLAFENSEREIRVLSQRTAEGLLTAKLNGKQVGRVKGRKYTTQKEIISKDIILKNSRDFNGTNTDVEVMKIAGIAHNTYYRYKRELRQAAAEEDEI